MLAALVLTLDRATGPYIRFPIAFVLPVFLMGWRYGRWPAMGLVYVMLVVRLGYSFYWDAAIPHWLFYEGINTLIRTTVLTLVAYLAVRVAAQTRKLRQEIKVLKGILPICAHCKKIRIKRMSGNNWRNTLSGTRRPSFPTVSVPIVCSYIMVICSDDVRRKDKVERGGNGITCSPSK